MMAVKKEDLIPQILDLAGIKPLNLQNQSALPWSGDRLSQTF